MTCSLTILKHAAWSASMKQQGIYRVCVSSIMAANWARLRLLGQLFLYKYLISNCVLFWERCHASIFHTMDWSRACIIYFCRRHSWKGFECRRDPTLVKTVWLSRFWSIDAQSGWRVKMICTHWWCDSKKKPAKRRDGSRIRCKSTVCKRPVSLHRRGATYSILTFPSFVRPG